MEPWKIAKRARTCAACESDFEPGQEIVSLIRRDQEGFVRRDLHADCFREDREQAFSRWRSVHPADPAAARKLDLDLALDFFRRLVREEDPERSGLVYLLALLLARKRRVRIRETRRAPEGEALVVAVKGDEGEDEMLELPIPALDEERRTALQQELERLFGGDDEEAGDSPE